MKTSDRRDAKAMLLIAGAVLIGIVVTQAGRWLAAGAALARSPLVPVLAGLMLVASVAVLLTGHHATRRALLHRVRLAMVPADSFNPTPEAVLRFAAGLARARRLGDLLHARANGNAAADTSPAPTASSEPELNRLDQRILDHLRGSRRRPTADRARRLS